MKFKAGLGKRVWIFWIPENGDLCQKDPKKNFWCKDSYSQLKTQMSHV